MQESHANVNQSTDTDHVLACPSCDSTGIRSMVHNDYGVAAGHDHEYYCRHCSTAFDEPVKREKGHESGIGYLAGELDDVDPDAVSADNVGEPITDGGTTLAGHLRSTVDSLTDRDRPGKPAYPRAGDVIDLTLIEREESLTEVCDEIGSLIRDGGLYQPSPQTLGLTNQPAAHSLADADAAEMLEGVLTKAEPALDDSECETLQEVAAHLRNGGEDIPVIVEEGDA